MSKMSVKVRGPYDDDYNSDVFGVSFPEETLTKQSFREECDINTIVDRWNRSGVAGSSFSSLSGEFADVSNVPDYHAALNIVLSAQASFGQLPSNVRERFHNDPGELLSFLSDPENTDEAIKLGLAVARPDAAAQRPQEPGAAAASEPPQAASAASSTPPVGA